MLQFPEWYVKPKPIIDYIEKCLQTKDPFAMLFVGKVGCGKTYLAEQVYNYIETENSNNHRIKMLFSSAAEVYREYLAALTKQNSDKNDLIARIESYLTWDVVVLDDLGKEMDTGAAKTFFSNLLCIQYDAFREGKLNRSIITTNYSGEQLKQLYGEHVVSRLVEYYTIVEFKAGDYRMAKAKKVIG